MKRFLEISFILREDIIKVQWKMKSTRERWQYQPNRDFLLIYHEYLFVFRKPDKGENLNRFRDSMATRQAKIRENNNAGKGTKRSKTAGS